MRPGESRMNIRPDEKNCGSREKDWSEMETEKFEDCPFCALELRPLDHTEILQQLTRVYTNPKHAKKQIDFDLIMDMADSICARFGWPKETAGSSVGEIEKICDDFGVFCRAPKTKNDLAQAIYDAINKNTKDFS